MKTLLHRDVSSGAVRRSIAKKLTCFNVSPPEFTLSRWKI
jgi:hypothetical protein